MKEILKDIIYRAGQLILERSKMSFEIFAKDSVNNLVTEVDREAEVFIKNEIKKHFPNHGFLAEEYGEELQDAEYIWIIDPIDGTVNYAHSIPFYCVSIALSYQGNTILGAIYNPVINELFLAERGNGAYLNNKKISVSDNDDYNKAFLVTGFPYHFPSNIDITKVFSNIVKDRLPLRRLGSAALDLAYVAAGRFDGFWEYNLSPWDIAAGYLLVEEAGGKVSNFANETAHYNHKETLATNGKIHDVLLARINENCK